MTSTNSMNREGTYSVENSYSRTDTYLIDDVSDSQTKRERKLSTPEKFIRGLITLSGDSRKRRRPRNHSPEDEKVVNSQRLSMHQEERPRPITPVHRDDRQKRRASPVHREKQAIFSPRLASPGYRKNPSDTVKRLQSPLTSPRIPSPSPRYGNQRIPSPSPMYSHQQSKVPSYFIPLHEPKQRKSETPRKHQSQHRSVSPKRRVPHPRQGRSNSPKRRVPPHRQGRSRSPKDDPRSSRRKTPRKTSSFADPNGRLVSSKQKIPKVNLNFHDSTSTDDDHPPVRGSLLSKATQRRARTLSLREHGIDTPSTHHDGNSDDTDRIPMTTREQTDWDAHIKQVQLANSQAEDSTDHSSTIKNNLTTPRRLDRSTNTRKSDGASDKLATYQNNRPRSTRGTNTVEVELSTSDSDRHLKTLNSNTEGSTDTSSSGQKFDQGNIYRPKSTKIKNNSDQNNQTEVPNVRHMPNKSKQSEDNSVAERDNSLDDRNTDQESDNKNQSFDSRPKSSRVNNLGENETVKNDNSDVRKTMNDKNVDISHPVLPSNQKHVTSRSRSRVSYTDARHISTIKNVELDKFEYRSLPRMVNRSTSMLDNQAVLSEPAEVGTTVKVGTESYPEIQRSIEVQTIESNLCGPGPETKVYPETEIDVLRFNEDNTIVKQESVINVDTNKLDAERDMKSSKSVEIHTATDEVKTKTIVSPETKVSNSVEVQTFDNSDQDAVNKVSNSVEVQTVDINVVSHEESIQTDSVFSASESVQTDGENALVSPGDLQMTSDIGTGIVDNKNDQMSISDGATQTDKIDSSQKDSQTEKVQLITEESQTDVVNDKSTAVRESQTDLVNVNTTESQIDLMEDAENSNSQKVRDSSTKDENDPVLPDDDWNIGDVKSSDEKCGIQNFKDETQTNTNGSTQSQTELMEEAKKSKMVSTSSDIQTDVSESSRNEENERVLTGDSRNGKAGKSYDQKIGGQNVSEETNTDDTTGNEECQIDGKLDANHPEESVVTSADDTISGLESDDRTKCDNVDVGSENIHDETENVKINASSEKQNEEATIESETEENVDVTNESEKPLAPVIIVSTDTEDIVNSNENNGISGYEESNEEVVSDKEQQDSTHVKDRKSAENEVKIDLDEDESLEFDLFRYEGQDEEDEVDDAVKDEEDERYSGYKNRNNGSGASHDTVNTIKHVEETAEAAPVGSNPNQQTQYEGSDESEDMKEDDPVETNQVENDESINDSANNVLKDNAVPNTVDNPDNQTNNLNSNLQKDLSDKENNETEKNLEVDRSKKKVNVMEKNELDADAINVITHSSEEGDSDKAKTEKSEIETKEDGVATDEAIKKQVDDVIVTYDKHDTGAGDESHKDDEIASVHKDVVDTAAVDSDSSKINSNDENKDTSPSTDLIQGHDGEISSGEKLNKKDENHDATDGYLEEQNRGETINEPTKEGVTSDPKMDEQQSVLSEGCKEGQVAPGNGSSAGKINVEISERTPIIEEVNYSQHALKNRDVVIPDQKRKPPSARKKTKSEIKRSEKTENRKNTNLNDEKKSADKDEGEGLSEVFERIDVMQKENDRLIEDNRRITRDMASIMTKFDDFVKESKTREAEHRKSTEKHKTEKGELNRQLDEAKKDNVTLKSALTDLEKKNEELMNQLKDKDNTAEVKKKNELLEEEINNLVDQMKTMQAQYNQTILDNSRYEPSNSSHYENEMLKLELDKVKEDNANLREALDEQMKKRGLAQSVLDDVLKTNEGFKEEVAKLRNREVKLITVNALPEIDRSNIQLLVDKLKPKDGKDSQPDIRRLSAKKETLRTPNHEQLVNKLRESEQRAAIANRKIKNLEGLLGDIYRNEEMKSPPRKMASTQETPITQFPAINPVKKQKPTKQIIVDPKVYNSYVRLAKERGRLGQKDLKDLKIKLPESDTEKESKSHQDSHRSTHERLDGQTRLSVKN